MEIFGLTHISIYRQFLLLDENALKELHVEEGGLHD